jgi:hypothetical protein
MALMKSIRGLESSTKSAIQIQQVTAKEVNGGEKQNPSKDSKFKGRRMFFEV